MRHLKRGRKLSRRKDHRSAMLANLAASLIKSGRVKTTDAKAKEVRPFVERLVTFAKRGDLHARRIVLSRLKDSDAVKKLFDEIGPQFSDRFGGYTRILKLGFRHGDNSPVSIIEFVGSELEKSARKTKATKKKTTRKSEETTEEPVAAVEPEEVVAEEESTEEPAIEAKKSEDKETKEPIGEEESS
ncbi:50S ribosomal protein L17 [Candidatus Latescibacterota bacterium]